MNRERRARFVWAVTLLCLLSAYSITILSAFGIVSKEFELLLEAYIHSAMGIATATVLAYIGVSSVDYNIGMSNILRRKDQSQ